MFDKSWHSREVNGVVITPEIGLVRHGDRHFKLPKTPCHVLALLLRRGRVSKDVFYNQIFPDAESKILDVYICRLRQFLKTNDIPLQIKSVWGFGYEIIEA